MVPYALVVDPFLDEHQESVLACVDSVAAAMATEECCTCHRRSRIPMVVDVRKVCWWKLRGCCCMVNMVSMARCLDLGGQEQMAVAFRRKNKTGCSLLLPFPVTFDTDQAYPVLDEERPGKSAVVVNYFWKLTLEYREE
jgi:hypothetical protein